MIFDEISCGAELHGVIGEELDAVTLRLLCVPGVGAENIQLGHSPLLIALHVDIDALVRAGQEVQAIRVALRRWLPIRTNKVRERSAQVWPAVAYVGERWRRGGCGVLNRRRGCGGLGRGWRSCGGSGAARRSRVGHLGSLRGGCTGCLGCRGCMRTSGPADPAQHADANAEDREQTDNYQNDEPAFATYAL